MILGIDYPLTYTDSGSLAIADTYPRLVRNAILTTLQTLKGEQVWRYEFGIDDHELKSINYLPDTLASIRQAMELTLKDYPETSVDLSASIEDTGVLRLYVAYQVSDSEPKTLTYDF
jgi:hypothetical protein